jgi:hypothetical protein
MSVGSLNWQRHGSRGVAGGEGMVLLPQAAESNGAKTWLRNEHFKMKNLVFCSQKLVIK